MNRFCLTLILSLLGASGLFAQRGGRGDALQLFGQANHHPHLLLQIKNESLRFYVCTSDLRKMPRSAVVLQDPSTGISHRYEGVALEYLLRGHGLRLGSGTLEVSYGRHQKMTVPDTPIDPNSEPLVADTIDGKSLTDYVPYFLILPDRARADIKEPFQHVDRISVETSVH